MGKYFLEIDKKYVTENDYEEYAPYMTKEKPYMTYDELADLIEKMDGMPAFIFDETSDVKCPPYVEHVGDYFQEIGRHGWVSQLRVFRVRGTFYGVSFWSHDDYGDEVDEKILLVEEVPTVTYKIKEKSKDLKN